MKTAWKSIYDLLIASITVLLKAWHIFFGGKWWLVSCDVVAGFWCWGFSQVLVSNCLVFGLLAMMKNEKEFNTIFLYENVLFKILSISIYESQNKNEIKITKSHFVVTLFQSRPIMCVSPTPLCLLPFIPSLLLFLSLFSPCSGSEWYGVRVDKFWYDIVLVGLGKASNYGC